MILFLIHIIFEIAIACSNLSQGICLTDISQDLVTIDVANPLGFRYGFWSKYLSMAKTYDTNQASFKDKLDGYTVLRQVDAQTSETLILLYQIRYSQDLNNLKHQKLVALKNNLLTEMTLLSFEASSFEGLWIYYSISYVSQNTIQFIYFNQLSFSMELININFQIKQAIKINLGGNYQFDSEGSPHYLGDYLGQFSLLDFQQPTTIFTSQSEFENYLHQLSEPKYNNICNLKVSEISRAENFQYESGLIFMESWVQLDYQSQLNISASVFGIEFTIQQGIHVTYQKLLDLHYMVWQAWVEEMQNLVMLLVLEKTQVDYIKLNTEFIGNTIDNRNTRLINQNLKEWHFVQVYYGFSNEIPVQGMKLWLLDETIEEIILNKSIYRFEDRKLIIRSGNFFGVSQPGVSIKTGLSKIYVCLPDVTLQKKCHYSCNDCDGPEFLNCLSCPQGRYLDNRQCKCNLGQLENQNGFCQTFENLYPDSQLQFIATNQVFFQFGHFSVNYNGMLFFIKCPKYFENSNMIYCVECLSNPQAFSDNPICKTDYILNNFGQYEIQMRTTKEIEFYLLDYDLQQARLCFGCSNASDYQIDDTYQFSVEEGKYIQCLDGYYQDNGKCQPCLSDCNKCLNVEICQKCDGIKVLNQATGKCLPCLANCEQCQLEENNAICIQCAQRYSLFQGNCMACGLNCQTCQYVLDNDTNQYYNRCIVCLDSSKYYLQLNAIHCGENTIDNCLYVIEFNRNSKFQQYDNTMFYLYPKRDYDQTEIITYCAWCSVLGATSLLNGECQIHPQNYIIDNSGYICLVDYEIVRNGNILRVCKIYSLDDQINNPYFLFYLYKNCFGYNQNCNSCNNSYCVKCFSGFYTDLADGVCYECPKQCYKCQQQSKYHKNGWKIIYRFLYQLFQNGEFYSSVFGDESKDQLEVVCTACNPRYELYKDQCIPECPLNCKTCIKVEMQNYCVECHSYDGKVLSLYQGTCIECPRYCSLCYPKSNELLASANPYFILNEQFVSTTHTCLQLEAGLNQNEFIYNVNLKQFLKYNNQQVDPNLVQLKFNLYCDLDKFYQDLQLQSDQESFLSKNVRIDEIVSSNSQFTNFNRFENNHLYQYLGTQQIQQVEFHFQLLQDCRIKQHSYLFTTLTKNVYAINRASVHVDGNFHELILEESLEILGFEKISIDNARIHIIKDSTHFNFQSSTTLNVIMNNVNVTSLTNIFSFQFKKIQSLTIQQFSFLNCNLKQVNSVFEFIDKNDDLKINFTNFSILTSHLDNTNLIFFQEQSQKITIFIQNFTVIESVFTKSTFIASQIYYNLTIYDLTINRSNLLDCPHLFMTNFSQIFTLRGGYIEDSVFSNTALIQLSSESKIDQFQLSNSVLTNSSSFTQNINQTNQYNIQMSNFLFYNITYDIQSTLLYSSTTNSQSQIMLNNWTLKLVSLNYNSLINTDSLHYLIYVESNTISIQQINLSRQSGITEFYLGLATYITISNMNIENGNLIPSLITNQQCASNFRFSRYLAVLKIEKSQTITFNDVSISNLVLFDAPIILIMSIESQFVKRSESIIISNFLIRGCILQKAYTTDQFSMVQVISEQKILINFQNTTLNYNFYHSQEAELETNSALAMYLFIENGNLSLNNCTFQGNYISQSKNSLMAVFAQNILITNSYFNQNNYFSEQLIKHINWGYKPFHLSINQLTNYFPVQSLSGNGKFSSQNIMLQNVKIIGGTANQGGCFSITLNNDGILTLNNSHIQNLSSETKGGCFYIIDKSSTISINLENSVFDSIFATSEGGVLYFLPSSQTIKFTLKNLTITDVFSLSGAFLNIDFFNSLTQALYVTDCKIISTVKGLALFIQKLGVINEIQKSQLISSTAIFVVRQGELTLINIVTNLFTLTLLEATFCNKVSLTSVVVENSYFSSKSVIIITCNQDQICKVIINKLQISNYQYYNKISKYSIIASSNEQLILEPHCQNILTVNVTFFQEKVIDLSEFGVNLIPQLIFISNIKSNDQISFKKSSLSLNTCQNCQNGLIQLYFVEQISKSSNFQFQNIQIFGNDCGKNGCLNFLYQQINSAGRLLAQSQNQITINQLICSNNQAINGGCIYSKDVGLLISSSVISINNASNLGGGIYYSGDVMNLLIYNNLISNNNAGSGSALYINENSSPELNRTNNFISSTTQLIQSSPTSLTVTLNNYENMFYNYHTQINLGFLTTTQDSMEQIILKLPSGQQINQYQHFNITSQEYIPLNITFRIVPLNDYFERQTNLTSTTCKIQSGYLDKNTIIITNNYTNIDQKEFNTQTQDYNFDDLIIYYGANNVKGNLILQFYCNSVKIPIYEPVFPYQINNYISNYSLYLTIQTLDCQIGEYKDPNDDSCHLCNIDKKQYSVKYGAQTCNFMDESSTLQIRPAQLKLKNGYWRLDIYNEIIEKCKNKMENCLGGWKQGSETCFSGQLGARCESCDSYNIRGQGQFSQKQLYTCGLCYDLGKQVLYIFATSIWMIVSIYLTTKGIEDMIIEIQKNRVGKIQLIINANKQTGPNIKMFTNYLQNIAIILNFNIDIPNALKLYFNILGNPQQQLLISTDCFVVSVFSENIIYVKIIQTFINPFFYGLIYLWIYLILIKFKKVLYNKLVITTTILYLFFYFQPQAIQLLIESLSFQTISGIQWIQANLAYQFYTPKHQAWLPYLIVLMILLGLLFPILFLIGLIRQRKEFFITQLRKNWGYLILEYKQSAYYWEFARILIRELIIITITFYQDNISLKCIIVFIIIIIYQQGTTAIQPFKTTALNQLDIITSKVCLISILAILSLTQTMKQYSLVIIFVIFPNAWLFISFFFLLLQSYLQQYEELLDKATDFIKSKINTQDKSSKFLSNLLQNRSERRKIVMQRFKLVKNYLYKKIKKPIASQGFKFFRESEESKAKFCTHYEILFTKSDLNSKQKANFLSKN